MKTKKWLLLGLALILLSGCAKKTAQFSPGADSPDFTADYLAAPNETQRTDAVLVSEGQNMALYYDYALAGFFVRDKRSGFIWKSTYDANAVSGQEENQYLQNLYRSMFLIEYVRTNEMNKDVNTVQSAAKQVVSNVKIEGGRLKIYYRLPAEEIGFLAVISLENDVLKVEIPADAIVEKSTTRIVQIHALPFFGAVKSGADGYLFYPDGSGALMDLQLVDKKSLNQTAKPIEIPIHGTKDTDIDQMRKDEAYASLPVLGIKDGGSAMVGYITEGASDASVNVSAENQVVRLNRNYFSFRYRYSYDILSSDISIQGAGFDDDTKQDAQDEKKGQNKKSKVIARVYDYQTIREDRTVCYQFLHGDDADYSGMARAYRTYLLQSGKLNNAVKELEQMPLAVDFFMGIKKDQVLYQSFLPMTTLEQARQINELFKAEGVAGQIVRLKGWSKGGYGIEPFKLDVERKIGGSSGMKRYLNYTAEHNIDVYLEMNLLDASAAAGGFSKGGDIVKSGNSLPLTDSSGDRYLLHIDAVKQKFEKILKQGYVQNGAGLCLNRMGSRTYYDYSMNTLKTKNACEAQWSNLLDAAAGTKGGVSVDGANSYALKSADVLFDVPLGSSRMQITDRDVPFLQMVLHGYIPYASEPGNLFYDHDIIVLKWLEYGCLPYYELTYQSSEELINTGYSELFSSQYQQCKDQILGTYALFQENLNGIWNSPMTAHSYDGAVVKITYESGRSLYLNDSDKDAVSEGKTIKARSFLITQEAAA